MRARSAVLGVFVCISWASLFGLPSALCADYSKPPPPPVAEWRSGFSRQSRMQGAVYSIGQPTAEEQYYVELINRARANPKAEGKRLAATKSPEVTSSLRYFGVDLEQMKREFATLSAMPPLAINPKLTECARGHSQDMFNRIPEVRRLRDLYSNHSLKYGQIHTPEPPSSFPIPATREIALGFHPIFLRSSH